jgi:hypothetical protein
MSDTTPALSRSRANERLSESGRGASRPSAVEGEDEAFWSQGHSACPCDLVLAGPKGSQFVEGATVDGDRPDARPRLRRFDLDPRSTDHDGLVDADLLAVDVHVGPAEWACLSSAKTRRCHQSNERGNPGIPRASERSGSL